MPCEDQDRSFSAMFSPSRLRVARRRRGLTKSEVASRAGLSLRSVSAYENDETEPEPQTIAILARVLGFPLEFFSAPELHEPPTDSASFRALSNMTAGQRDAAPRGSH